MDLCLSSIPFVVAGYAVEPRNSLQLGADPHLGGQEVFSQVFNSGVGGFSNIGDPKTTQL